MCACTRCPVPLPLVSYVQKAITTSISTKTIPKCELSTWIVTELHAVWFNLRVSCRLFFFCAIASCAWIYLLHQYYAQQAKCQNQMEQPMSVTKIFFVFSVILFIAAVFYHQCCTPLPKKLCRN